MIFFTFMYTYVYIRTRICIYTRTRTRTGTGVHRWVPCFLKDTRKSRFLKCRGVPRGDAQDARASPTLPSLKGCL